MYAFLFSVPLSQESRSVHQLQYMSWPDHGVPSNPDHILTMVEEARSLQGAGPGPLCVHCRFREQAFWDLWRQKVEGEAEKQAREVLAWKQPFPFSCLFLRNFWSYVHDTTSWHL